MSRNLVYLGVVVLAVIAVILGYNIYQQQTGVATTPSTQPQTRTITQPAGNKNTPQANSGSQDINMNLISKKTPNSSASTEEKQNWENYLRANRQKGSTIIIKDCMPTPPVLIVEKGEDYKIQNDDNVNHKLTIPPNGVTVKAKETLTLKASEWGEFGYSCDTIPNNSNIGIIHILRQY